MRQCIPREDKLQRRREQGKENNVFSQKLVGTLRSDNGDVHVAEKQASHHFKLFAIILIRPVTQKKRILAGSEERGTRSSSDRDGGIYRLAVPVTK